MFVHEAASPSVQISSEGPGKSYCRIVMDDRCSCITYDSNGKLRRKRPKAPYKPRVAGKGWGGGGGGGGGGGWPVGDFYMA